MHADFARFGLTSDDYDVLSRFIERASTKMSTDPDVQADLTQEMWLKCFLLLDDPPDTMPAAGKPRNKYLTTAMANHAMRFKSFDAPLDLNHKPQYDRMTEYSEEEE